MLRCTILSPASRSLLTSANFRCTAVSRRTALGLLMGRFLLNRDHGLVSLPSDPSSISLSYRCNVYFIFSAVGHRRINHGLVSDDDDWSLMSSDVGGHVRDKL